MPPGGDVWNLVRFRNSQGAFKALPCDVWALGGIMVTVEPEVHQIPLVLHEVEGNLLRSYEFRCRQKKAHGQYI
jgi:hypothetical protein